MAQVSDTEGAQLPARGKLIEDSEESALVCQLAESLQQPPTESL